MLKTDKNYKLSMNIKKKIIDVKYSYQTSIILPTHKRKK